MFCSGSGGGGSTHVAVVLFMLVEKITYVSSTVILILFLIFMVTVFAASSKCAQTVCTGRTPKYCTVGWVLRCGTRQDLLGFNLC